MIGAKIIFTCFVHSSLRQHLFQDRRYKPTQCCLLLSVRICRSHSLETSCSLCTSTLTTAPHRFRKCSRFPQCNCSCIKGLTHTPYEFFYLSLSLTVHQKQFHLR